METAALTPAEALIGGLILALASDPGIRAMAEANDAEHFIEGCKGPQWDTAVTHAALAVRDACVEVQA